MLFVGEEGVDVDERFADAGIVFGKVLGEFDAALGEEGGFERDGSADAPGGFSEGLD